MIERFNTVRGRTEQLVEPLALEDFGVQPMDDASPPKWHMAHTTWFFETFILLPFATDYQVFHPQFEKLFNSYYNGVGQPFARGKRGNLSRPTVKQVYEYRAYVDEAMRNLLAAANPEVFERTELGLHHEQQHQELLLTDLKYNFGNNPLAPAYRKDLKRPEKVNGEPAQRLGFEGELVEMGASNGFSFDNETPRHSVYSQAFAIHDRVVTNGEYLAFMEDGGYERHELWLSDGWSVVQRDGWQAPLYWRTDEDSQWQEYTFAGLLPVNLDAPVVHVSGYEADAYARWAGARLPTEVELERAAAREPVVGNFVEADALHPQPCSGSKQIYGDVWEWTSSAYGPYPGYQPLAGALGEYNGKFMANQLVLRGGSCATAESHMRASYRNFFYPPDRWQFSGIRLAFNE